MVEDAPDDSPAAAWDWCQQLSEYGLHLGWDVAAPEWDRRIRLLLVAALRAVWTHIPPDYRPAVEAAERYADARHESVLLRAGVDEPPDLGEGLAHVLSWRAYETLDPDLVDDRKWPLWVRILTSLACDPVPGRDQLSATEFHLALFRDIFGNPYKPVAFDAAWRSDTAVSLAKHIYEARDFGAMPILADALQDAGCEHDGILTHCRDPQQVHVRGCWVVDLVLGKG
ncbi:hypothetical protein [Gemmata sp.]|uniref:hypothetical protein n=1 Tax=Gemmata sp. TaxID=1914242 RepID=UPI003F6F2FB8